VLLELIAERYERKSIAITANAPFSAWDAVFPDKAMTVAALDRLVHHATILEMNADSYRRPAALPDAGNAAPSLHDQRPTASLKIVDADASGIVDAGHSPSEAASQRSEPLLRNRGHTYTPSRFPLFPPFFKGLRPCHHHGLDVSDSLTPIRRDHCPQYVGDEKICRTRVLESSEDPHFVLCHHDFTTGMTSIDRFTKLVDHLNEFHLIPPL
jgi:hypothetical protein